MQRSRLYLVLRKWGYPANSLSQLPFNLNNAWPRILLNYAAFQTAPGPMQVGVPCQQFAKRPFNLNNTWPQILLIHAAFQTVPGLTQVGVPANSLPQPPYNQTPK